MLYQGTSQGHREEDGGQQIDKEEMKLDRKFALE